MSDNDMIYSPRLNDALQRLDALIDWERGSRLSMRVDLSPVTDLLDKLGAPQTRFRAVHVTGTKGKGSVCSLVDAGLREAGLRAGRYASPHLERVHERIHVDGRQIDDDALSHALSAALDARDLAVRSNSAGADATWFDVMTAAAFVAFANAEVDWAVVEVGIGGLRDSTNVISSTVAVITNIGLEHTDVLGDTIEAIAAQKAGIVKCESTLVTPIRISSPEGQVILRKATEVGAHVIGVELPADSTITQANLATARAVLSALGELGHHALARGTAPSDAAAALAAAPGRLERLKIQRSPPSPELVHVVLDGAHVDFALAEVLKELRQAPELRQDPIVLLALGRDKNAQAMLRVVSPSAKKLVCVPLDGGRPSWAADELAALALSIGIDAEASLSAQAGFARCLELASGAWVLVTGSLHLVGTLRGELLVRQHP